MSELNVTYERDGTVAFIEIDRADAGNRFTYEMMLELMAAVTSLPAEVGAVLLAGSGGTFCLGADGKAAVAAMRQGWSDRYEALVQANHDSLAALLRCPVPYIAAIDGPASGMGAACALIADGRFVTARACLCPNQLRIGLPLDTGLTYALRRALGPVLGMELLLDPSGMSGQEMLDRGLASGPMYASGDREAWLDAAARLADTDPFALKAIRQMLETEDFDELWQREVTALRESMESGRLRAILDRRFGPL